MNRLSTADRTRVIAALVEGNSIRSTVRMTGIAKNTVAKLLCDIGTACVEYHDAAVRNVKANRVQCDEVWSFVGAKAKNVTLAQKAKGAGDVWTWVAIDADSKLAISYKIGGRDSAWAYAFMEDLASRLSTRVQITTDGHSVYANAVEGAFGMEVDYAMLIKVYGSPSPEMENRYSPAQVISTETRIWAGNPDPKHISTSFIERQNLTMRMSMRRFTRLTNAFSKKLENHKHAIALYFAYYNFCRVHQTLRVTPAMEAGLTDHVWTITELVQLLDAKAVAAAA
jgi:IS1 family transposase